MKKLKKIPIFRNEYEEFEFWASHNLTDYMDLSKSKRVIFPNLKPSTTSVLIRLPEYLLFELKMIANKRDVPCQSLMKIYLAEKIREERKAQK